MPTVTVFTEDDYKKELTLPEYCNTLQQLKNNLLYHLDKSIKNSDFKLLLEKETNYFELDLDEEIYDDDIFMMKFVY